MVRRAKGSAGAQDAQVPPTTQAGPESATGAQLGKDRTIPQGADRGSKTEIEGGDEIRPDSESPKAIGAQLEPARFSSNGQIPHNHVPTPSGSIPVGATGLSVADARARVEEVNQTHDDFVNRRDSRKRLPRETIQRLHKPELRAIAEVRGYALPENGERAMRQAFIEEQDNDQEISDREDSVTKARGGETASGAAGV